MISLVEFRIVVDNCVFLDLIKIISIDNIILVKMLESDLNKFYLK